MIFLDTSFIVSYYNTRDINHNKSLEIMQNILKGMYGDVSISDYIFDESATLILYKLKNINKTKKICNVLKKLVEFNIDKRTFEESWNIFSNQKNSNLSFTDCSTLAVIKESKISFLASFDKEFQEVDWIKVIS